MCFVDIDGIVDHPCLNFLFISIHVDMYSIHHFLLNVVIDSRHGGGFDLAIRFLLPNK